MTRAVLGAVAIGILLGLLEAILLVHHGLPPGGFWLFGLGGGAALGLLAKGLASLGLQRPEPSDE
ncbi:MAG TPA: hypothetical protein VLD61_06790 [Methylomirabilota bacterium]|nr:hypothetical protein [Methylomirabilota bacterium]